MRKVIVSAPGKLHLSGEHAVVYGKPALIATVGQRMQVILQAQSSKLKAQSEISKIRKRDKYIDEIVRMVEHRFNTRIAGFNLEIESDIPKGAGMGSSAALAVSLVGALITWLNKPWDLGVINELAYEAEKFKHGNPSGSDPTISTYGGLLWYRKELPFLKSFLVLSFKIPKIFASFVLVDTGRKESTGELVSFVGDFVKQKPVLVKQILNEIEEQSRGMTQAIHDEDEEKMRNSIKENERLLEKLGVVSDKVKKFIREIEELGGAAKISGAGGRKSGSGIVICSHDKPQVIEQLAQKYGYPCVQTELGGKGVRIESILI